MTKVLLWCLSDLCWSDRRAPNRASQHRFRSLNMALRNRFTVRTGANPQYRGPEGSTCGSAAPFEKDGVSPDAVVLGDSFP